MLKIMGKAEFGVLIAILTISSLQILLLLQKKKKIHFAEALA